MRAIKSSGTKPELFIDSEFFHGKDFDVKKETGNECRILEKVNSPQYGKRPVGK